MATLIAAVVVGYLVGAISPATLIARARGVDLRAVGSGNPGATNAGRALGRRTGLLVAVLDVAKGAVPTALFGLADHRAAVLAGLAAVLGHITSPFLRGRGGKGVATAAGAVLGVHPLWVVAVLVVWLVNVAAHRWIALASVLACVPLVLIAVVTGQDRVWAVALALLVVARHTGNLRAGRPPQAR